MLEWKVKLHSIYVSLHLHFGARRARYHAKKEERGKEKERARKKRDRELERERNTAPWRTSRRSVYRRRPNMYDPSIRRQRYRAKSPLPSTTTTKKTVSPRPCPRNIDMTCRGLDRDAGVLETGSTNVDLLAT